MSDATGALFSDDLYVRIAAAAPAWDVTREAPELLPNAPAHVAGVAAALAGGVPVLRSVQPLRDPAYARPPGHLRAFYVTSFPGGVVAVKGSEPLAFDWRELLDGLARARVHAEIRLGSVTRDGSLARAELSALEKFPIIEGKVPGCVTLREALADARAAAAIQRAHVARTGELARLPLPIWVGRWPDAVADRALEELAPRLRGRALDVVEMSVRAGLGVYVYAYPTVPLRLAQLAVADARTGGEVRARLATLGGALDPRRALESWIALTARLFAMGFVSADPTTVATGDALQVQNVVLDGGLADVESLIEASRLDDRALRGAVRHTVHELAVTATRLLLGLRASSVDLRERMPDVFATVWTALGAALEGETPRDARVAAVLLGGDPFDRLVTLLGDV